MSRAAAQQAAKKDQKAAIGAKNARNQELKDMGLTTTMKQAIGDDRLLCTTCGATVKGHGGDAADPAASLVKCICPGGVVRPGPDFEVFPQLIAAARARMATVKDAKREDNLRDQAAVQGERTKKKAAKANAGAEELENEYEAIDGVELVQTVEFAVGKMGCDLERNAICKVTPGGQAEELGVHVGWVVQGAAGVSVELTGSSADVKKRIMMAVAKTFKAEKPCKMKFRCPLNEGTKGAPESEAPYAYCFKCDKFLERQEFLAGETAKVPGARMCWQCAETADMFGGDEEEEDY